MIYFCAQKNRRTRVLGSALNGIDYLEVADDGTVLSLVLLKPPAALLSAAQIAISGGETVTGITVLAVTAADPTQPTQLKITVNQQGDFSPYTLTLRTSATNTDPPPGFDPVLSSVVFSFRAGFSTGADCQVTACCPPPVVADPDINYLAKDFPAFQQAMLDRMAVLLPDWTERHASDLGNTLVELLAYVADHLSYRQDAVATEAYLGTARSRISLRRHARLVDYAVNEGANACAFVHFDVTQTVRLPAAVPVFPRVPGLPPAIDPGPPGTPTPQYQGLLNSSPVVFETMAAAVLVPEQNQMSFYTWGDADCCLPAGATSATLSGTFTTLATGGIALAGSVALTQNSVSVTGTNTRFTQQLQAGQSIVFASDVTHTPYAVAAIADATHLTLATPYAGAAAASTTASLFDRVLVFEEILGPDTGDAADADPSHRWLVRLVSAATVDANTNQPLTDPLTGQRVTEITWLEADALPFPLCISAPAAGANPVSVARGNMVAADHGLTRSQPDTLGPVPPPPPTPIGPASAQCSSAPLQPPPVPFFFPALGGAPLTFARAYDPTEPASAVASAAAQPVISVIDETGAPWQWYPDLLTADESTQGFVVEIENDATAYLRFGDGRYGMAPAPGQTFSARYRTGNGSAGNVGADSLGHVAPPTPLPPGIAGVRNPLAAAGGVDGDTMATIRATAPYSFRTQLRAVTEDDYAAIVLRDQRIVDARGTFRWTGSWRTAFVSIDPATTAPADITPATAASLELMRMAGTDVVVEGAVIVGLNITLLVAVQPHYRRTEVNRALAQVFTSGAQPNGEPGLLDADQFTFGQTIYLSPFIAAAQNIDGVAAVQALAFQRVDDPATNHAAAGFITLHRLEIARINSDPNRPDLGTFTVLLQGGQ